LLVLNFCILNFIFCSFTTFAEGAEDISFKKAEQLLLLNNKELKSFDSLIYDRKRNYENALKKEIDEDIWYKSNYYGRMFLLKTVELYPLQMEHTIKTIHYENELKAHDINKAKYNNNLISKLEIDESEYNLFDSQIELNIAKRNYENTCRDFNLFIGSPIEVNYTKVEHELLDKQPVYDLNYYIKNALKNRTEIKSSKRNVNLNMVQKEIIERNGVYITYTNVGKEHKSLISSMNMLDSQLKKTKLDINKEIIDIFYDTMEAFEYIKSAEKKLDSIKGKLYLTEAKIKAGVIPKSRSEQIKLEIKQAEYEILNATYRYNTLVMKLNSAAAL
jgi:hypothetical protein